MSDIDNYYEQEMYNIINGYMHYPPNEVILLVYSFIQNYLINAKHINLKEKPSKRHLHASTVINNIIYIFGGYNQSGEQLNDLYSINSM